MYTRPNKINYTYKDRENKIVARSKVFDNYKNINTLIGLAGPDITDYVKSMHKRGYRNFYLYENNTKILLKQLSSIHEINGKKNVTLYYGDILNAPVIKDAVYDLDFTVNIMNVEDHIRKFKDNNMIITTVMRPLKLERILWFFCQFIDETFKENRIYKHPNGKDGYYTTKNKGVWNFLIYNDSQSYMMMIYKIAN